MPAKILKYIIIIFVLIVLGGLLYFFLPELEGLVGLSSSNIQPPNFIGENITFNAGSKPVSIPPKFNQDVLDTLRNMNQTGGMPLKVERKGNPLPFGIP